MQKWQIEAEIITSLILDQEIRDQYKQVKHQQQEFIMNRQDARDKELLDLYRIKIDNKDNLKVIK